MTRQNLLNYTTSIEALKTVGEIQGILVAHGARAILMEYSPQQSIEALSFKIDSPHGELGIRLPIKPDAILEILKKQYQARKVPWRYVNRDQAVRIAWRILKDWVEAQMAILETEMVKLEEIFLPYILHPSGQTLFEVMESRNLLQEGRAN